MAVNALLGIAVPVCLSVWLVRKHHARPSTILIGAGTFILFALVLESIMHQLVLKGPHGAAILGNTLWYAIYGGLAAGVFEETGRFLSMKFLMKKEPSKPLPGIAYGVGHGGAEMLIIFGITMIGNLSLSALINSGQADVLFAKVPEESAGQLQAQLDQLQALGAGTLLIGLWERFSALILHVSLSVLVWVAVRKGGRWLWLFPAAIALHAIVDAGSVLLQKSAGTVPLELIVTAEAIAVAAIAYMVTQKKNGTADNKGPAIVARRDDWKTEPMPGQHETFVLDRSFSDEEMDALRRGNIPQAMEDKWFWYMEGSTLRAHRSWTGHCIYQIDFKEDGHHVVTVNRDPEQYKCDSVEEDLETLNHLLDWWARGPYDHYNEWLSETSDALKKASR